MKNLQYKSLEIEQYLSSTSIYPQVAKEAFKWRTRMINFKMNFPNGTDNIKCPLGCMHNDSQEMMLSCSEIMLYFPEFKSSSMNYSDVFSNNPIKIKNITNILEKIFKKRENLIQQKMSDQTKISDDSN